MEMRRMENKADGNKADGNVGRERDLSGRGRNSGELCAWWLAGGKAGALDELGVAGVRGASRKVRRHSWEGKSKEDRADERLN